MYDLLSMYDILLPPGLKGLRPFLACYEFLDEFIESWIKFGFEEKRKGTPHTQVFFHGGLIHVSRKITLWLSLDCFQNHIVHDKFA